MVASEPHQAEISKPDLGQMFLQQDHTGTICEPGDLAKLAVTAACLPVIAADDCLDNLLAVEPMLNATIVADNFAVIELASRPQLLCDGIGRVEIVERSGRLRWSTAIFVAGIIEQLIFASEKMAATRGIGFLGQILDAAVATGRDSPFKLKVEALECLCGADRPSSGARMGLEMNHAIDDFPFVIHGAPIGHHPAVKIPAIEERECPAIRHHDRR